MDSNEAFEKWWAVQPEAALMIDKAMAKEAWKASEANAVKTLAGEWGEFEVGPVTSLAGAVEVIRDTGRMLMRYVYQEQDWMTWANAKLKSTHYKPDALRKAVDRLHDPSE